MDTYQTHCHIKNSQNFDFCYCFLALKMAFFANFKFQTLITRNLSLLEKNHKSTLLFRMTQKVYKNLFEVKKMKNRQFQC